MKAPMNRQFAVAKIYENEFSQIGLTLLTRAMLCAGLMALVAGGVAVLAGN
jgi:hypothetical protein